MNELLLIGSVVLIFGTVILAYKLFGKAGLFCVSAIATVLANIEVIILVKAFGMEQTLGNVLFASTFLITDILSECEGRKEANKAVTMSIFVSVFFLLLITELAFVCAVGRRYDDAVHKSGILEHAEDDTCVTCGICCEPVF